MSTRLFSTSPDLPWMLTDIQLVQVFGYDGREYYTPHSLGHYREPTDADYPLCLEKNFNSFVDSQPKLYEGLRCLQYLRMLPEPLRVLGHLDFCTNRKTLIAIMCETDLQLIAIKFRGCIYLKYVSPHNHQGKTECYSYVFKLRHFLIVDQPGDMPNIDRPVDFNKQNYGTFTAKLGKFRLIYSSVINGVENSEPLGNLNDPEVLKQCRFISMRVVPTYAIDWRINFRIKRWLLRSYLMRTDLLKVAFSDWHGLVATPIVTEDFTKLEKEQSWSLSECFSMLHQFLSNISDTMSDIDCPYTAFVFKREQNTVTYSRTEERTENSFLGEEYINFVLDL